MKTTKEIATASNTILSYTRQRPTSRNYREGWYAGTNNGKHVRNGKYEYCFVFPRKVQTKRARFVLMKRQKAIWHNYMGE